MIKSFMNSSFSRPTSFLISGAVISTKRFSGVSFSGGSSIDQLPYLDDEKAKKLAEKIEKDGVYTCLTPELINKVNEISRNREAEKAFRVFLDIIKHSEYWNDKNTKRSVEELERHLLSR